MLAALAVALFAAVNLVSAAPSAAIKFTNDSDGIVSDDSTVDVSVVVTDNEADVDATLVYVRVNGGLRFTETDTEDPGDANDTVSYAAGPPVTPGEATWEFTLQVPAGTTAGEYIVSARVDLNGSTAGGETTVRKTLRVGPAGDPIGAAELSLADDEFNEDKGTDSDSSTMGTPIYVKLAVVNSLGNLTDNVDVTSVDIIAAGGTLWKSNLTAAPPVIRVDTDGGADGTQGDGNSISYDGTNANAVTLFSASRATAGSLDVYAVIVGKGGATTSNTLTLTFTGDAEGISLGDPSTPLGQEGGRATVDVTATDGAGNPAALSYTQITSAKVLDSTSTTFTVTKFQAPKTGKSFMAEIPKDENGDAVTGEALAAFDLTDCDGVNDADGDPDAECDATKVRIVIETGKAAAGEHTLQVKLGEKDTEELTIVVAGAAKTIEVTADKTTVGIGDVISVVAEVTDEDGNTVVNDIVDEDGDGGVEFTDAGALELTQLDKGNRDLKNGEASVRFVVTKGSGSAIIIATYGKLSGTVSVSSEAAEAMPEEEASVACLSTLSGFSTWSCGVDSSASEIFELVSGRGATAIHLWNGSAWVRYSVVDGTMVPGSSDFMVTENDILYISN